jgi:hypothetical protein
MSAIGPIDRCTMRVREIVFEMLKEMPREQWPALIAALRDELDDIEKTGKTAERTLSIKPPD